MRRSDVDEGRRARGRGPASAYVSYALPVVLAVFKPSGGPIPSVNAPWDALLALAAYVVIMTALVWQQQIMYVNPMAAILGYHFHSAKSSEGESVLIVSRRKSIRKGAITIVSLSDYLWLHVTD